MEATFQNALKRTPVLFLSIIFLSFYYFTRFLSSFKNVIFVERITDSPFS